MKFLKTILCASIEKSGNWSVVSGAKAVSKGLTKFILILLIILTDFVTGNAYGQEGYSMPLSRFEITSAFGKRKHPLNGEYHLHKGIDLAAKYVPVYAVLSGQIERIGYNHNLGYFLELRQGQLLIQYAHLSLILVATSDKVEAGDTLAISGKSGKVTGPHLHFAVRFQSTWIDPLNFLSRLILLSCAN